MFRGESHETGLLLQDLDRLSGVVDVAKPLLKPGHVSMWRRRTSPEQYEPVCHCLDSRLDRLLEVSLKC